MVSCTGLRHVDEGQTLYTGSRINIESVNEPVRNKREIESELEAVLRPEPNTRILFSRPRLWIHNVMGDTGESGIDHWIQTRFGRPPVLFRDVDTDRRVRLMENRLFNIGYFDAEIDYSLRERRRRTSIDYQVSLRPPYRLRNIFEMEGEIPIVEEINRSMEFSLLDSLQIYRLQYLREERERIDRSLKELGYFFFHPDYLIFRADTTISGRRVDLYPGIKPATPAIALNQYRIRNIYVDVDNPGSWLSGEAPAIRPDDEVQAKINDGVYIVSGEGFLRPHVINKAIFFRQGALYTERYRRRTLRHLMGLGVFRFVNVNFDRVRDDSGENLLDARVVLIPMEQKALSVELRGVSKSNDFAGPGITGTFLNRNWLGGAEQLRISVDGAFETLLGGGGVNSIEAGISSEVRIPRLVPFEFGWITPELIPSTRMALTLNYLNRTDAFSLASLRSEFGYIWNPSVRTQQRLSPFVFSVFGLGRIAPGYEQLFERDILLRRGLFEQFILGSEYSYLYNSQLDGLSNDDWYFNLNLDIAGNSLWLLTNYLGIGQPDEQHGRLLLGQSFSQYGKADVDFRYYVNIGSDTRLATRFIAGIGVPYGNSATLPYTRRFAIGGTTSIRAFHPRRLGPGSYTPPEEMAGVFNIYQAGEIKLETNVELRYSFGNIFNGALFLDAGNIWNLREEDEIPGGRFEYPEFIEEIALGTGLGIRLDFTFFLLRLDLAFPLADPRIENSSYFQPVRPLDSQWRRDNLIFNLAIGYPF
jgi:outer membrane protein insertion porin family